MTARLSIAFILLLITLQVTGYAQVNTEKLRRDEDARGLAFSAGTSIGLVRGNSEFVSVAVDLRLDYSREGNDNFIVADYSFKEAQKGKIANRGFLHLRSIWDVASSLAVEGFTQAEFNEFLSLTNRDLLGAGVRWHAVDLGDEQRPGILTAYLGVGLMFEHEEYDSSPSAVRLDRLRSTNYLTLNWSPSDRTSASLVAYLQPLLENPEDLRATTEAAVQWEIIGGLSFQVRVSWRYHSRPMTSVKRYDLELGNGLRLTLP